MAIDIYAINKHKLPYYTYDITESYDYSNINFINGDKEFKCTDCDKKTLYWTSENKCPSCSYKTHKLRCDYCYRSICCVSCGGKQKKMMEIDRKVFCRNNRCLMPFGYFINYEESKCTCSVLNGVDLCKDLQKYVSGFIKQKETCWNRKRKLPDLSYSNDDCTHCRLNKKYRDVSNIRLEKAIMITCNCY